MANRTIQFWGQGYAPTGTDPIVITATLNGNVVYTGNIPTLYTSDVSRVPADQVLLFTCELPMEYAGTFPMSILLNSPVRGNAFFEQVFSNYMMIDNPVYTESEIGVLTDPSSTNAEKVAIYTANAVPPLSAAEIAVLETGTVEEKNAVLVSHNLTVLVSSGADTFLNVNGSSEPRSNVVINGAAITRDETPAGTWGWLVGFSPESGGTLTYDLTVVAGQE